jgi:uncharacterized protein (TIGR04255 family)
MSAHERSLPDFGNPPVTEVALSVQFKALESIRTAHLGLLWEHFRKKGFSRTEDHSTIEPVHERFDAGVYTGDVGIRIKSYDKPPVPRIWFLNVEGTELVQVQTDRFVHNWRKVGERDEYVRYPRLRDRFHEELRMFEAFLAGEGLGSLSADQCEVTYINHIYSGDGWDGHGEIDKVVTVWAGRYSDSFLGKPESASLSTRYVIPNDKGEPLGRLHIELQPAFRLTDLLPMIVLNLTARGTPIGSGTDGVMRFLDLGREWIVRGFTSITTTEMHKIWRRKDVR